MINLPFFKRKEVEKDFFLALFLKQLKVGCILFQELQGVLTIFSTREEPLTSPIHSISDTDLLNVFDAVISDIEKRLPEQASLKKTVFVVPYDWVEDAKIKKGYLLKLKRLCEELSLTPIGFIIHIEAVVHFLQKKEGAPISGVFVEIAGDHIVIYLVKANTVLAVKSAHVVDSLSHTVEHTLKEIEHIDILPSKIFLLDHEGAEHIQQEFLSHHWTREGRFLHVPQVVVLEKGFENEAVINGVAQQLGFEILDEVHVTKKEEIQTEKQDEVALHEHFDFLKDEDVLLLPKVAEEEHQEPMHNEIPSSQKIMPSLPDAHNKLRLSLPRFQLGALKLPKFRPFRFSGFVPIVPFKSKFLFVPIALVIIFILFLFSYYNFILKADVILFLDKKTTDKTLQLILSTSKDTSIKDLVLKTHTIENEVDAKVSQNTTGKKEVGEKAKGSVTLYSRLTKEITLSQEVMLLSSNNLEFTLDKEVKIASSSGDASAEPATAKVSVTAKDIGGERNLPSGTKFTVKSYDSSDLVAKNESAFAGGTKREIKVVSKDDIKKLSDNLIAQQTEKALAALKGKLKENDVLLPFILSSEFVEKKYDKKEDEEGDKLTLSAKLKFVGASYNKNDLDRFIQELSHNEVPRDYHLDTSGSQSELKDIKLDKNNMISATLVVHSVYLSNVDTGTLLQELKGKNKEDFGKEIKKEKGIVDYKVKFSNDIALFPYYMPFDSKNIHIVTRFDE